MQSIEPSKSSPELVNTNSGVQLTLNEEQFARVVGALTIVLSAPINMATDDVHKNVVANLLDKILNVQLEEIPSVPSSRRHLATLFSIQQLQLEGWKWTGPYEGHMDIVYKSDELKIQIENGGTGWSTNPVPGLHFYVAKSDAAKEIWDEKFAGEIAKYDQGRQAILELVNETVPTMAEFLISEDWGVVHGNAINNFCRENSREVIGFLNRFNATFGERLLAV